MGTPAKRLSQPGIKRLTSAELQEQLSQPTLTARDLAFLEFTRDLREAARSIEQLEVRVSGHDQLLAEIRDRTSSLEGRVSLSAFRAVPRASIDRPAPAGPVLPRAAIVEMLGTPVHLCPAQRNRCC